MGMIIDPEKSPYAKTIAETRAMSDEHMIIEIQKFTQDTTRDYIETTMFNIEQTQTIPTELQDPIAMYSLITQDLRANSALVEDTLMKKKYIDTYMPAFKLISFLTQGSPEVYLTVIDALEREIESHSAKLDMSRRRLFTRALAELERNKLYKLAQAKMVESTQKVEAQERAQEVQEAQGQTAQAGAPMQSQYDQNAPEIQIANLKKIKAQMAATGADTSGLDTAIEELKKLI